MKTSPKMQQIVQRLATQHGVNLNEIGGSLRLDMPGFDPLCIHRISATLLSVAHRYEAQGVLVPDPEVIFLIGRGGGWIAVEVTQVVGGKRTYVQLSEDGVRIVRYAKAAQADLAYFVKVWAHTLQQQGWLESATKHVDLSAQLASTPLFALGQVVATPGALAALEEAQQTPEEFLVRHVQGDWASLDAHDRQANQRALKGEDRILSAYETKLGTRIWLITEWDRSITTLLVPAEY